MVKGPWWIELVKTVGPTAVIALGLVYWLTQSLSPVLGRMGEFMATHSVQMQDLIKDEQDDAKQRTTQWQEIARMQTQVHADKEAALKLEEQTCINTSKSTYQSQKCMDIRNGGETALGALP